MASGVVSRVTLATVVLAPEPLTRYAIARRVEDRFGGEHGILRTKLQHAYAQVPALEDAGLIRVVGRTPTLTGKEPTKVFAATQAGVADWRGWLAEPVTMPDAMRRALAQLYSVRREDFATMIGIIDRFEALLQQSVHQTAVSDAPAELVDRMGPMWNRRLLVAQLQWCQHARDAVHEAMAEGRRR